MIVAIYFFKACSDKLFAGKQVNLCPVIPSGCIVHTAKSVDFFFPFIIPRIIFRIILEGKPIKSSLRIVRGIQRDAENLVTIV